MKAVEDETPQKEPGGEYPKSIDALVGRLVETEAVLQALLNNTQQIVPEQVTNAPVLLRKTQQALLDSYHLLEHVSNTTQLATVSLDLQLRIVRVNQTFAAKDGRPAEFFTGKKYFDLFPLENGERLFRRTLHSGVPYHAEAVPYTDPDRPERGTTYWNWSLLPIRDTQGNTTGLLLTSMEVTRLQHAQNQLQENQRMFQQLFEAAPDASLVTDAQGKILQINRQVEHHFGYARDELLGKRIETLLPERFSRRHVRLRGQYQQNPIPRPMGIGLSLFGRRKNGTEFPVDVTLSPIETNEGTQVIAVVRDISRRVEAERLVSQQTSYIKLLQDVAMAANGTDSVREVLQFALDRICKVLNWPVGHALLAEPGSGLRSTGLWYVNQPERFAPFRAFSETLDFSKIGGLPGQISRTGKAATFKNVQNEPEFRRGAEAKVAGLVGAFAFPILVGKDVVGVLEFFDEKYAELDPLLMELMANIGTQLGRVIEREQARQALRRSEARFRTIFEKSAIGIQVSDADGYILDTNPALQAMLGFSGPELKKLALTEITHPGDLEKNWALLKSLLRRERSAYQIETRYMHKNGSTIWTELTVSSVLDVHDKIQFVVILVRDISELKRKSSELDEVQRKLLESAEMERISLARELHDGPLQDLYGASFSLQDFLSDFDQAEDVSRAASANRIMQEVIVTLRSICGELRPPTLGPFGLEKAIRSHVERLEVLHPELRFHQELVSDRQVLTERARLTLFRVYQQLITNVLRHANAQNVWIRFGLDEHSASLEVEDDGQGFLLPDRWVELAREGHAGLLGILERVEAFGGTMQVDKDRTQGAAVRVQVPRDRINR